MSRIQMLVMATCIIVMSVGCRNRCNNPCGGGLFAGGSSTIGAPATYSLNIPSVAQNQPYYVPGSANNSTLNPNGRAPTAAALQANQQNQAGWKSAEDDLSNSNPGNNPNGDTGRSVLAPTTFVQTGTSQSLPGTGQSYTDSRNYQTTSVDERRDATRLPVTDATTVRAPARNFPTGANMVATNNGYPPGNYTAGYNVAVPQTYVAQNGFYQRSPTGYAASPVIIGGQPMMGYQGQPVLVGQAQGQFQQYPQRYPTSGPPTVLAQATATSPGGSAQVGWRDRDLTSGRTGRY